MIKVTTVPQLPDDGTNWRLMAQRGGQGERGLAGANLVFRGTYNPDTTYDPDDAVEYNGSVYYCTATVVGETPQDDGTSWDLFLARGSILVSDSAPASPTDKQVWIDSTTDMMNWYDSSSSSWIPLNAKDADTVDGKHASDFATSTEFNEHQANDVVHRTQAEKDKLAGIESNANNYSHPSTHPDTMIDVTDTSSNFTATKLDGVLDELFTFADNGKTNIASVVGSPATASDTFNQLQTTIQNAKNTMATNLNNKGTSASGTEDLQELADKIANVNTGKKWASGTTSTIENYSLSVTGLDFEPNTILIRAERVYGGSYFIEKAYSLEIGFNNELSDWKFVVDDGGSFDSANENGDSWTIYQDGFEVYLGYSSDVTMEWIAFE